MATVLLIFVGSAATPALVIGQSVDSFTLINADTDTAIQTLADGDAIDLSALPTTNLSVRANVSGTVESVRFGYDGNPNFQLENVAPYALAGDIEGDYTAWTPAVGSHTITATPYAEDGGSGTEGTPLTVDFTVTEGTSTCTTDFADGYQLSGELKRWHPITLTVEGPCVSEAPTTFLDHRFDVTFIHSASGTELQVPGYFAADGNAAESGATGGNKWRAHLTPNLTGEWSFTISFRIGTEVAISSDAEAGSVAGPDGLSSQFTVGSTDKTGRDHRAKGMLRYVGERYLRFDNGEIFLKGGADSPENLLAFSDFDNTTPTHEYQPHEGDWTSGDPSWKGGKGKGLIGGLNYLASEGMNAFSFLTMNVTGDGDDVWPWTEPSSRTTYDVSKLGQWEIVFTHADRLGLFKHFKTQETENDQLLDGGSLGLERKLYYRELIARFAHHHALNWNLGEENTNTDGQREAFANYIRALDPYDHPVVVHTYPGQKDEIYTPLLGLNTFDGPSLQLSNMSADEANADVIQWISESKSAGRVWNVSVDEPGNATSGLQPDSDPNYEAAREVLWATFLGGGDGLEWYFGYNYPNDDLDAEDWRSRDQFWDYHRYALQFMRGVVELPLMEAANALTSSTNDFVLATPGEQYIIYRPGGSGAAELDLGNSQDRYMVQWYDPRNGGAQQSGSITAVEGPGTVGLGEPPSASAQDWVLFVRRQESTVSQYTVEVNVEGSGSVALNPDKDAYVSGENVELTAVPASSWVFAGWSGDVVSSANPYTLTVTGDAVVTATFVEQPTAANFTATLQVQDAAEHAQALVFGVSESASDDFDAGTDEKAPPLPPSGAFDARLENASTGDAYWKDIRAGSSGSTITWSVRFQPASGAGPVRLDWTSDLLPAGSFRLRDVTDGSEIDVNMKTRNHYVVADGSLTALHVEYTIPNPSLLSSRDVGYSAGWNLMAAPLDIGPLPYGTVFPAAESETLFGFHEETYQRRSRIRQGSGYWLAFPSGGTQVVEGYPVSSVQLMLRENWNLVTGPSACTLPLPLTSEQDPSSVVTSVYTFLDGAYATADLLRPGVGYWVMAEAPGVLTLDCAATDGSKVLADGTSSARNASSIKSAFGARQMSGSAQSQVQLRITDGSRAQQTLLIRPGGGDAGPSTAFALPPRPPRGAFDARFEDGTRLSTAAESKVLLQASVLPLTVEASGPLGNEKSALTVQYGSTPGSTYDLRDGQAIVLTDENVTALVVRVGDATQAQKPNAFALRGNYPNPVTTMTGISIDLPEAAVVRIEMYNTLGQRVMQIGPKHLPVGTGQMVSLDATGLASGIYFYQVTAQMATETVARIGKMVVAN